VNKVRMVVVSLIALALAAVADARLPERVLHFPSERAVGNIRVQDEDLVIPEVTTGFHPGYAYAESEFLGLAQGDVRVPAGRRVFLTLGGTGAVRQQCLETLQSLDPNALYSLSFMPPIYLDDGLMPSVVRLTGPFTDSAMTHLAAMPVLRVLWLDTTNVTDAGLQWLSQSKSIERLCLHWLDKITDRGVAHLKNMPQLKGLNQVRIKTTSPISRPAIARLRMELPSLQTLEIGPPKPAKSPATRKQ